MEAKAIARHIGISARKARLVINTVRGQSVSEAIDRLAFMPNAASKIVSKLILSADANARSAGDVNGELVIKEIRVDGGPYQARYRPRAMGRMFMVRKRSCHISVTLTTEA